MGKLILTRKPGESVKIGDSLMLTIREVHPKRVWASIDAEFQTIPRWYELGQIIDIHGPAQGQRGAPCRVTIAAISGRQVRLHFEADNSIKIVRTELL